MRLSILIIGAGGHGKVCVDVAHVLGLDVVGFLDNDAALLGREIDNVRVLGGDGELDRFPPSVVVLVNGVGSTVSLGPRRATYERLAGLGYHFERMCHPHAPVARSASLGNGVQVMAGAVIQPGARIEENCIINSGAVIEHDCIVGAHSHVAPGAVVCGGVTIGAECHVGAGATIVQGISLGDGAIVAAGAVVVRSVPGGQRVAGVPAYEMGRQ